MTGPGSDRLTRAWLWEYWERRKTETVRRVRTAIELLVAERRAVTISAIREKVVTVIGVPFSANTIKRNEAAYALYLSSRLPPRNRSVRDVLLCDLYQDASEAEQPQLYAKVARLRRESKDNLIARLIALERAVEVQAAVENRLREEIIRNSLQSVSNQGRARDAASSPPPSSIDRGRRTKEREKR